MNFFSIKMYHFAILFLALATFSSCGDDEPMELSIVETAQADSELSSLVAALTQAGLVTTLSGDGPFTVFAPTNDAFLALLATNDDWNGLADIDIDVLAGVLTYHVVNGANVQADQLTQDQTITTLSEGTLTVDLVGEPKLGTSSGQAVPIIVTDVQGTNGVIHAVSAVLSE